MAATGKLVLFGVQPTEAHTGYGYIRQGAALEGFNGNGYHVDAFFEKPEKTVAETYWAAGNYVWNSGIFVLNAKTFIDEMARLAPRVLEAAREALDSAHEDLGYIRLDHAALSQSPNTSIDYALMEQTSKAAMLPLDIDWSDVGSWASLWELAPQDEKGNFIRGEALLEDTEGCYVHSERSLVSTIGVENLVIVDTPDALLVADKSRSEDVSKKPARTKAVHAIRARWNIACFVMSVVTSPD